ncbi:DUF349 domain-containing protein, partial [Ruminococcus sp.]|uniref:DUF349 domain-containing protein n=1 Tax=Ruminococcus sp. TaxID=41978 RepID=UPI0025886BB9
RWIKKYPNFDDPFSKTKQRAHSSGAKIIEVIYGARDSNGRPKYPENDADGHGHWIALELDGNYQILSWRLPRHEGGQQLYGSGRRENALFDLENDIRAKENICMQAEMLCNSYDLKDASSGMKSLFDEWKKIFNWHTPSEDKLWRRFDNARKTLNQRRDASYKQAADSKQRLIIQAKSILSCGDFSRDATEKMKALSDQWKGIGFAGKEQNDKLWEDFRIILDSFYQKKKERHDAQQKKIEHNIVSKKLLISKAESIARLEYDKSNIEQIRVLQEQWKETGFAGDQNDSLWNSFRAAIDAFYTKKKQHQDTQQRKIQQNIVAKQELISRVSSIAMCRDYSKESADQIRSIQEQWKEIGYAGEQNDYLWNSFRSSIDSFFTCYKAEKERKHAEWEQRQQEKNYKQAQWREKMEAVIERKQEQISNLYSQIDHLKDKMLVTRDQMKIDNMYNWISEKEAKIRELEEAISDIRNKLLNS